MSGNKSKVIAFNYFGGKFTLIDELYKHMPSNIIHFVDLFAGSMVVSLNYKGRTIKTVNEINADITNFFEVLRNHEEELVSLLELTPCSEQEFDNCWEPSPNKIEQARRFYVRVRQSFFGLGAQRQNKGFHMAKRHTNAQGGETVSRWNNAIPKLHEVALIIRQQFQILNLHYLDCIDRIDFPGAFFYCDPPYVRESRASYNDYKFEFTDNDHRALAERLYKIEGRGMVSGYDCKLMKELYEDQGWTKIVFPIKRNNIRSSLRKEAGNVVSVECIWVNYEQEVSKQLLLL